MFPLEPYLVTFGNLTIWLREDVRGLYPQATHILFLFLGAMLRLEGESDPARQKPRHACFR